MIPTLSSSIVPSNEHQTQARRQNKTKRGRMAANTVLRLRVDAYGKINIAFCHNILNNIGVTARLDDNEAVCSAIETSLECMPNEGESAPVAVIMGLPSGITKEVGL